MADKKTTGTEVPETPVEINEAPWALAVGELRSMVEKLTQELASVKSEIRTTENRLNSRISVIDQRVSSPASASNANKLPNVGDTINDAEVVHVSSGVPGISGPSVVTRGRDRDNG